MRQRWSPRMSPCHKCPSYVRPHPRVRLLPAALFPKQVHITNHRSRLFAEAARSDEHTPTFTTVAQDGARDADSVMTWEPDDEHNQSDHAHTPGHAVVQPALQVAESVPPLHEPVPDREPEAGSLVTVPPSDSNVQAFHLPALNFLATSEARTQASSVSPAVPQGELKGKRSGYGTMEVPAKLRQEAFTRAIDQHHEQVRSVRISPLRPRSRTYDDCYRNYFLQVAS